MKYFYIFLVVIVLISLITGIVISIIDKSVRKELERIHKSDFEEDNSISDTREYAFTIINDDLKNVKKELNNNTNTNDNLVDDYNTPVMIQSFSIDDFNKTRKGNV